MPTDMESYVLIASATTAVLITVPLLVRMAQKGFSWAVRLYVAVFACGVMLLCQTAITGSRPLGYFPEIVISASVAIGLIAAFCASYANEDSPRDRVSVFRSFF